MSAFNKVESWTIADLVPVRSLQRPVHEYGQRLLHVRGATLHIFKQCVTKLSCDLHCDLFHSFSFLSPSLSLPHIFHIVTVVLCARASPLLSAISLWHHTRALTHTCALTHTRALTHPPTHTHTRSMCKEERKSRLCPLALEVSKGAYLIDDRLLRHYLFFHPFLQEESLLNKFQDGLLLSGTFGGRRHATTFFWTPSLFILR